MIAALVRIRDDLRLVTAMREQDIELRLLMARHRGMVTDAARGAGQLEETPASGVRLFNLCRPARSDSPGAADAVRVVRDRRGKEGGGG